MKALRATVIWWCAALVFACCAPYYEPGWALPQCWRAPLPEAELALPRDASPELMRAAVRAAHAWEKSTGIPVAVTDYRAVPNVEVMTGARVVCWDRLCERAGETSWATGVPVMRIGPDVSTEALAHELGHALAGNACHTAQGLMAPRSYRGAPWSITPEDVRYVLEGRQ